LFGIKTKWALKNENEWMNWANFSFLDLKNFALEGEFARKFEMTTEK
jgi:hypothetical protein